MRFNNAMRRARIVALILSLLLLTAMPTFAFTIGSDSAQQTLDAYLDFQDPFSARWWQEVLPGVQEYVQSGWLRIEIRHFPLEFHPDAMQRAIAVECAAQQGVGADMAKLVFGDLDTAIKNMREQYASRIPGFDVQRFIDCAANPNPEVLLRIENDRQQATDLGVSGVPTFFIGKERLVGAQGLDQFVYFIKNGKAPEPGKPVSEIAKPVQKPVPETKSAIESISPPEQSTITTEVKPVQDSKPPAEPDCRSGCLLDEQCIPYGQRLLIKELQMYCGLNGNFEEQRAEGQSCQNSYECKSNQCSNAVCVDLSKQLAETNTLLEKIASWFRKLFGFA